MLKKNHTGFILNLDKHYLVFNLINQFKNRQHQKNIVMPDYTLIMQIVYGSGQGQEKSKIIKNKQGAFA